MAINASNASSSKSSNPSHWGLMTPYEAQEAARAATAKSSSSSSTKTTSTPAKTTSTPAKSTTTVKTTTATKTTSSSPTTSSSSTSSATPAYIVSSSAKEAAAKASSSSSSSASNSATGAMGASYSSDMAREAAAREAAAQATAAQSKAAQAYEASKKMITPAPKTNTVVVGSTYTVQDRGDIGMNAKGQIYALPVKTPQTPSSSAATKTSTKTTSQTTVQLAAQAAAMATENMINAASKKLTDQNRNNAQLQAAAMSTETMINDAARKVSAQQSKLVSQQSNISDAFTRSTVAERMIQEVTDRQVGTQKALVAKTETAIQTQMQAKSSGVDLDMLKQMSSVGYKSLHGEAAADLFKANFYIRSMDDMSMGAFSAVNPNFFGMPKGASDASPYINATKSFYALDEKYLLEAGAKKAFENRITQLQAGYGSAAWTMEALFIPDSLAGNLTPSQCVDKMLSVMQEYEANAASPQTKDNKKPLGDDPLLDGMFNFNVGSCGNMTVADGDAYMSNARMEALYATITLASLSATNASTRDPQAFYGNPDAGSGKVTGDDYAAGGFKTGSTQGMNTGALEVMESNFDEIFESKPNTATFWSGKTDGAGGAERALEIAKQNGGTTLEGMIESNDIKMPEWDINNPASIKVWEDASLAYAKQVSGEVKAVVGFTLRNGSIWENIELPMLKNNPNVTKITIIDPKTMIENIIYER